MSKSEIQQRSPKIFNDWKDKGEILIVCLDCNKNIYTKDLGKALLYVEELGLKGFIRELTGE